MVTQRNVAFDRRTQPVETFTSAGREPREYPDVFLPMDLGLFGPPGQPPGAQSSMR